jgi:hypothetical protein
MQERGTRLRILAKATEGYERTSAVVRGESLSPTSLNGGGGGRGGVGGASLSGEEGTVMSESMSGSVRSLSGKTQTSVVTLDLVQSMKLNNARYGLAMKQGASYSHPRY